MSMCSVSVNVQYLDAGGAHRGGSGGAGGGAASGGGGSATLEYHALPPPPPPSPAPAALQLNHGLVSLSQAVAGHAVAGHGVAGHPQPQAVANSTPAHRQLHNHHIQINNPHLHQIHQMGDDAASARWTHYQQLWRQHQIIINGM